MVGNRTVDVDKIDTFVSQDFVVAGVSFFDAELIAALLKFRWITSANGRDGGVWMRLIN